MTGTEGTSLVDREQTGSSEGGGGVQAEPGPSQLHEGAVSHDSFQSRTKRKKSKPHPLVLNSHLNSQPEDVAMATEGPLSPSSTPVTITIHSPTGVGTVSGTMEVVPVSTTHSKRSSVITSTVECSKNAGGSDLGQAKETAKAQPPSPWFHLLPRDPCNMPCNLQRLIDQCSDVKDKMGVSPEVGAVETAAGSSSTATEGQPVMGAEQSSGENPGGWDHRAVEGNDFLCTSLQCVPTTHGTSLQCVHTTHGTSLQCVPTTHGTSLQCVPTTLGTSLQCVPTTHSTSLRCVPTTHSTSLQCVPTTLGTSLQCVPTTHSTSVQCVPTTHSTSVQCVPTTHSTSLQCVPTTHSTSLQGVPTTHSTSVQCVPTTHSTSVQCVPTTHSTSLQGVPTTHSTSLQCVPTTHSTSLQCVPTTHSTSVQGVPTVHSLQVPR